MDQERPEAPAYQPPTDQPLQSTRGGGGKRKIIALWLLIGPTALIVGSLILYAIVNFILASTMSAPADGSISSAQSPIQTIMNIILFIIGAVSVLTWLPGIIVGIVLLATEKKS